MRIIVHDYAGHAFPIQLSRNLAARGHEVLHLYCGSTLTPRGELQRRADDPDNWQIQVIDLGEEIPKTKFFKRFGMERRYGGLLVDACLSWKPDVVISGQTPTIAQQALVKACTRAGLPLVSWIQDIYGMAAKKVLESKLPIVGAMVGDHFLRIDKQCAARSRDLVVISEDFADIFADWGIPRDRIHTIHNWALVDQLPVGDRDNDWSRKQQLGDKLRFVYSGTLAMKHNPRLLLELAEQLTATGRGELVVVSGGPGVEWLREQAASRPELAMRVMGFQPFEDLPDVLASADVLVAILEPDAGVFSVPSKVLSYLCADRPLLMAMPSENLAAKIVRETGAGLIVAPDDIAGFCDAGMQLADSPEQRAEMGAAGRAYAEATFDIERITDRFEQILGG
ncbi:putative glycosyl transferase [Posidoniimonas polymericola]|uniref:Putative glycosyl transferase n=1 Tax=Posidoniimonas polymericola TaxID=2528002 RepID=A0A5C5YF94_9BACT|nr:glycosyltransferase family 4 protein [Posidoniimonas polymericola]TWT73744.1 putative glycosyl transferase [Posidoniimonas polymericola]